ncbi:Retrovirus-related Pol polyprotein from transposon TNT 1-94 [Vitis vinifera]|uniref:Retrovirus-related Pol polyprotein from transposon TNT 1-94 n=1 Tax=Vitis vinifera TaxID=29760 RepID=A0A438EB82_VITVI|nr:Retrovirus-related Pol polyprotein from transposon TNT 1-94 [Vitis vinifera]
MKNGSSVREHVLKMIHHFNEAEINGAKIDEKTQVGMILETLSPSFLQFRTNYIMNHKKCNLTELLNELQSYETLIDDKGGKANIAEANAVVGKASSSRNKRREIRPLERNCKKYLDELKQKKKQDLEEGAFMMRVGSGARVSATAVWDKNPRLSKSSKNFVLKQKKQLSKSIKTLRSDRGGEYLVYEFKDYLIENGILSQLTAPGTPQQNGVAERRNRTLLDMMRSMMSYSSLPPHFGDMHYKTAVYILNIVPSKSIPNTPLELWNGRKPSLRHIRIWGCPAHVLKGKTGKLEPRSEVCMFVGYPKGTREGMFYSAQDNKVFVSTNATFLEYNYMADFKPRSKVVLEELLADEISPMPTTVVERQRKETTAQDLTPPPPRRSGREIRLPIRYRENGEAQVAVTDGSDDDPLTFKMAMDDVDREKWQEAMKLEIESMYSNSVWELVDLPEGIKPIGCKWIYKRKRGPNGKVETFKARLVAKGFTQKEGVDYEDTFHQLPC